MPLVPARLMDTRDGTGAPRGVVGPGATVPLRVTGVGGVPTSGVTAVVLNVTAVGPTAPGHVIVYPAGQPRPGVSNLNLTPGLTLPNLVVVKTGTNGVVNLYNNTGSTDLIADVAGYFTG